MLNVMEMHSCDYYRGNGESCKSRLIHRGNLDRPLHNCQNSLPSSSTPKSQLQSVNALPSISKIPQPAVEDRYFQSDLVTALGHLGRYQTHTSADPLDVLLPIRRRQHQIPQPIRQIVGQLGAQQIHPIRRKPTQGKVTQKFRAELTDPSFCRSSFVMHLPSALARHQTDWSPRHSTYTPEAQKESPVLPWTPFSLAATDTDTVWTNRPADTKPLHT